MSMSVEQPRRERPRFRDTALASGLVDEAQVAAAEASVAGVMDRSVAPASEWDQAVADRLVQDGLLTAFQARELLAGRRRFRLGQYTVLDEVARGGMGQVFRAEHAMMGREVAIKVLPRAKATDDSEAAFRREMRMLGRLDHENLVRAFDAGYDGMVYYLVTELVPGLDLKRHVVKQGPLDEVTAASVIAQAARGLAYAHEQGLVHRDVKPGNLLVMPDGRVKVLDLGLAGSQLEEESSRLGRVVGTMDYIAPEQIRAPDDVGPSADIYALGCTLYYAVSGQVPFPGGTRREKMQRHLSEVPPPVQQLVPGLSGEFCQVIEAMMVKDPAARLRSAGEVVDRLRRWTPAVPAAIPHADGNRSAGRVAKGLPPPLPEEPPPSRAWLARWASQDSSIPPAPAGRRDDDVPWLVADRASAVELVRSMGPRLAEWLPWHAVVRSARSLAQAAILAAIGGLMFGGAMTVVRQIDPEKFSALMRGFGPAGLGLAAFGLILVAQLVAAPGRTRRRP
jgi:eukaryotic-like serine/threonine-protein kinase